MFQAKGRLAFRCGGGTRLIHTHTPIRVCDCDSKVEGSLFLIAQCSSHLLADPNRSVCHIVRIVGCVTGGKIRNRLTVVGKIRGIHPIPLGIEPAKEGVTGRKGGVGRGTNALCIHVGGMRENRDKRGVIVRLFHQIPLAVHHTADIGLCDRVAELGVVGVGLLFLFGENQSGIHGDRLRRVSGAVPALESPALCRGRHRRYTLPCFGIIVGAKDSGRLLFAVHHAHAASRGVVDIGTVHLGKRDEPLPPAPLSDKGKAKGVVAVERRRTVPGIPVLRILDLATVDKLVNAVFQLEILALVGDGDVQIIAAGDRMHTLYQNRSNPILFADDSIIVQKLPAEESPRFGVLSNGIMGIVREYIGSVSFDIQRWGKADTTLWFFFTGQECIIG